MSADRCESLDQLTLMKVSTPLLVVRPKAFWPFGRLFGATSAADCDHTVVPIGTPAGIGNETDCVEVTPTMFRMTSSEPTSAAQPGAPMKNRSTCAWPPCRSARPKRSATK